MSEEFTSEEWAKIRRELNQDPVRYGLPQRQYGSVVIASFNIRKLGRIQTADSDRGRDAPTMRFLADVCRHFDLVAVQEVLPETAGITRLCELTGPDYGLLLSDVVGTFPGESGNEERLAYLYNRGLVRRGELVTEVTTSRNKVLRTMAEHHQTFFDEMDANETAKNLREYVSETLPAYREALARGENPREPRIPRFSVNVGTFVQFIRTPFAAAFEVQGHPGLEPYRFLAVNAHLHFGRPANRRAEAGALIEWILGKVRSGEGANTLLLGDLNFDFDNPTRDLQRIQARYEELGGFDEEENVFVSFPFIFPHPRPLQEHPTGKVFRSNIVLSQTYDQIGVFSQDERLRQRLQTTPDGHSPNEQWGQSGAPDYGVFDFVDLFSRALNDGRAIADLSRDERSDFLDRFEHRVSDHMPIWIRIPLPSDPKTEGFPVEP